MENDKFRLEMQSLNIFYDKSPDDLKSSTWVTGRGYLVQPNPYMRIDFTCERQSLEKRLKLKITDARVWSGLNMKERKELALEVKRRFRVLLNDRLSSILNAIKSANIIN